MQLIIGFECSLQKIASGYNSQKTSTGQSSIIQLRDYSNQVPMDDSLTVNNALSEILGYSKEELIKLNIEKDIYKNPVDRASLLKTRREKRIKGLSAILKEKKWKRSNCKIK